MARSRSFGNLGQLQGGGKIRTGKGTGEWEEAEAECHGVWSPGVHGGNCTLCSVSSSSGD